MGRLDADPTGGDCSLTLLPASAAILFVCDANLQRGAAN
jgi:hypothetical protein